MTWPVSSQYGPGTQPERQHLNRRAVKDEQATNGDQYSFTAADDRTPRGQDQEMPTMIDKAAQERLMNPDGTVVTPAVQKPADVLLERLLAEEREAGRQQAIRMSLTKGN